MKPLLFTNVFSPRSETFIHGLAVGLHAAEPWTRIATLRRINEEERPFAHVDVFPFRKTTLILERALPHLCRALQMLGRTSFHDSFREYLRANRPDVVHAHFAPNACAVAAACKAVGVPLVVSFRGFDASASLRNSYWRREIRAMLGIARAAIVVSEEMRGRIAELSPRGLPVATIHAGKEPAEYAFNPKPSRGTELISVGRLTEKKGHDDAIRATAQARRSGLDARLKIIGAGPLRQPLEKLARELQIREHVKFEGSLDHVRVKELMARADYMILASRTARNGDMEGIPNVLKEAQLLGVPFVATKHGGTSDAVPEMMRQELVDEGDWHALAARLSALHALPGDALASRLVTSRLHIEKHFSLAAEVRAHVDLYRGVLVSERSSLA